MTTPTNAQAAESITAHHVELSTEMRRRVQALLGSVRDGRRVEEARRDVLAYLDAELLPHAAAEEQALYPACQRGGTALLVRAMLDEHRTLLAHVDRLRAPQDPLDAAATASALLALFESHLAKENDLLVPALVADPEVSLGSLLEGMHEVLGADPDPPRPVS